MYRRLCRRRHERSKIRQKSYLQAVCDTRDTRIARSAGCVSHEGFRSATSLELACTRVNRRMLINVCVETIKPVFEGNIICMYAVVLVKYTIQL